MAARSVASRRSLVSTCKTLIDNHIPFGVITRCNLEALQSHRVVVSPNCQMMDEARAAALREHVGEGGSIYANECTSPVRRDGRKQLDSSLADLFGVSSAGKTRENFPFIHYVETGGHLSVGYLG